MHGLVLYWLRSAQIPYPVNVNPRMSQYGMIDFRNHCKGMQRYAKVTRPYLLSGKPEDKTEKKDKKESEKHKDAGSGVGIR